MFDDRVSQTFGYKNEDKIGIQYERPDTSSGHTLSHSVILNGIAYAKGQGQQDGMMSKTSPIAIRNMTTP